MNEPAKCTLFDFLDGPDIDPSPDWVAAVTHRGRSNDESAEFADRALAAQQLADEADGRLADLRARRSAAPRDDEAVGVLVAAFNVKSDRAFECLLWVSEQSGTSLPKVTQLFMRRYEALGADGHNREAVLGLLDELADRGVSRAG